MANLSPFFTDHGNLPATADLIGTPASIRPDWNHHTDCHRRKPLDSVISDTARMGTELFNVCITARRPRLARRP